ncbi:MAG TPA: maleylpyruvate isomerase N-terminal domain-containing protein [Streptosporangiaceae bacterium]|nr:maleylpyruvate isomerase N-terminal domain-containing protein [Streptosporangiaceae bacterium]
MDYAAALTAQNQQLGELLAEADWSVPVPTCPGWTLLQLLRHVGRGDRWAAQIITDRADTSLDPRSVKDGKPPADAQGAIQWLAQSPPILLAAVQDIGPGTEVSTFTGRSPPPGGPGGGCTRQPSTAPMPRSRSAPPTSCPPNWPLTASPKGVARFE